MCATATIHVDLRLRCLPVWRTGPGTMLSMRLGAMDRGRGFGQAAWAPGSGPFNIINAERWPDPKLGSRLRLPSNEPPVESERNPKVQNDIFGEFASRLGLVAKSAFRGVRTVPERNPKVAISFGFRQKIWCRPSWRTREHFSSPGTRCAEVERGLGGMVALSKGSKWTKLSSRRWTIPCKSTGVHVPSAPHAWWSKL